MKRTLPNGQLRLRLRKFTEINGVTFYTVKLMTPSGRAYSCGKLTKQANGSFVSSQINGVFKPLAQAREKILDWAIKTYGWPNLLS